MWPEIASVTPEIVPTMMNPVEISVWIVAATGWMLDWATTVWPDEDHPEQNPYVVDVFGEYPHPVKFGVAKGAGLVLAVILYRVANQLLISYRYFPESVYGIDSVLLIPSAIGLFGWHGAIHNALCLFQDE